MRQIKQIWMVVVAILLSEIMVLGISTAMAGEPQDIIEKSSGYPIGLHSKQNIYVGTILERQTWDKRLLRH
ncbi:MAG: hypothetical protein JRC89_06655 [Deltaproteobacteria bacterium]|nr:hypothetical protein [Deltaproteobacteria bacterium]